MALTFPNRSRSYDDVGQHIRFLGHDGMFEIPFLIEIEALANTIPGAAITAISQIAIVHLPGRGKRSIFWPLISVGNVVALHITLKIIQFGQSAVAGVDAEFDVSRIEFACLVYGLLSGQVIDRKDVRLFAEFYGITHCPCSHAFR